MQAESPKRDAVESFQAHFDSRCAGLNPAHELVQPA